MPDLTSEQVTILIGLIGSGIAGVWQFFIRPREKRLTALEAAQAAIEKAREEAKASREEFRQAMVARIERAEGREDAANDRAAKALESNAAVTGVLQDLTKVISDGDKSAVEEIRRLTSAMESFERRTR